jgi:deoxycytidine triphosphate deaminase
MDTIINDYTNKKLPYCGFLTDTDIGSLIDKEIVIHPYNIDNLTPVGYNISFSEFIYSLATRTFVNIIDNGKEPAYFIIKPNETVLVLSNETIWVSKNIGGTFHSKVSIVTKGLGHVSTTLDPGWHGQLLIPVNNPTKRKIQIPIRNVKGVFATFITLVLYRSGNPSHKDHDNHPARLDLLKDIVNENKSGKKQRKFIELLTDIENSVYGPKDIHGDRNQLVDLNNSENREENIRKFKENYDKFNIELQKKSHQTILLNYKKSLIRNNKIRFFFITFIVMLILAIISFIAFNYDKVWYGDLCKILTPILISLSCVILNNNKGKFI